MLQNIKEWTQSFQTHLKMCYTSPHIFQIISSVLLIFIIILLFINIIRLYAGLGLLQPMLLAD